MTPLDLIGAALDHVPERKRGKVLVDARAALAQLRAEEAARVAVEPVLYVRMINGEVDWGENCIADGPGNLCCDDEGASERPLYAAPQASPSLDKGPWAVGQDDDPRKVFVESADFHHDVRLYINGDFATDNDRREYAERLAQALNTAPQASGGVITDAMVAAALAAYHATRTTQTVRHPAAMRAALTAALGVKS